MRYLGIDIGSTNTKVAFDVDGEMQVLSAPTLANINENITNILDKIKKCYGVSRDENTVVVSTGYGRNSVENVTKKITEITCHAMGAIKLFGIENATIIDIGGQDTKVIIVKNKIVEDFIMNDKCSAGTGKFIEVMAKRLNFTVEEIFEKSTLGTPLPISSMCTVFAESEIVGYIGEGKEVTDIASGVIESLVNKTSGMANKMGIQGDVVITGGFSGNKIFVEKLSRKLNNSILFNDFSKFAGAIGAYEFAKRLKED